MNNNPENLSLEEINNKLHVLTCSVISAVGPSHNRETRIEILEGYAEAHKTISKEKWVTSFCVPPRIVSGEDQSLINMAQRSNDYDRMVNLRHH